MMGDTDLLGSGNDDPTLGDPGLKESDNDILDRGFGEEDLTGSSREEWTDLGCMGGIPLTRDRR